MKGNSRVLIVLAGLLLGGCVTVAERHEEAGHAAPEAHDEHTQAVVQEASGAGHGDGHAVTAMATEASESAGDEHGHASFEIDLQNVPAVSVDAVRLREMAGSVAWEDAELHLIVLEEEEMEVPEERLEAGRPYIFRFENQSTRLHDFTAPEFFRTAAVRKIQTDKASMLFPYAVESVQIRPGGVLEIYFVPAAGGIFPVYCAIDGHADSGMDGVLHVASRD